MNIKKSELRKLIYEEITTSDKKEIRAMIEKEIERKLSSRETKKMIVDEFEKILKKSDTKKDIGEMVKKVLKQLYKDLSVQHPYIIDRVSI